MGVPTLELLFFITMKESNYPPVKVAILIDGGFFIKRFNSVEPQLFEHIDGMQSTTPYGTKKKSK